MNRRLYYAIGLLSASIIGFQLSLMHLLSFIQWNHFAYMVISVAMLGYGASGTFIALTKKWLLKNVDIVLFLLMLLSGIFMSGIIIFSSFLFGKFDSFLLFMDKSHFYHLILSYFLFFIPFFTGATAIGLSYLVYVKNISFLYFADLFGSGLGGLAMLGLLWLFYPAQLPPFISIFPLLAAILIMPESYSWKTLIPVLATLLLPIYLIIKPPSLPVSEYKSISKTLNLPDSKIICEKKSPYGQIQLVKSNSLRYAPGLSLNFTGDIPVRDVLFCNGNWYGPVINWSEKDSIHFMDYTTQKLPYLIFNGGKVLILESLTGLDATHAMSHKADAISLNEQNKVALNILKNISDKLNNSIYLKPTVNITSQYPRSVLLSDTLYYDLIILPTIESVGGNSGINALKEQYIFTLEAFQEIYNKLNCQGIISVTVWLDYPVRAPLKILATLVETFHNNSNEDIANHLVAIRSWGAITYVLKKSPVTDDEVCKIRNFCEQMYFDPLLLPKIEFDNKSTYNYLEDQSLLNYTDQIVSGDRKKFYQDYDFNVQPSTDNKPFFLQFIKLRRLNKLRDLFGQGSVPYIELGYIIVLFTFLQISLIAFLLIMLPLFFTGWRGKKRLYTLFHFSSIGAGFMFVEIIFIQQFTLYFGHPVYSASAVLCGMLICSGCGSYISSKLKINNKSIIIILLIIIACLISYSFILTALIKTTINLPFIFKILVSVLIISLPAFFMGMPFPLGLKILDKYNKDMLPWAWGINGFMSVISTVLATIIAVEAGYFGVMILAGVFYTFTLTANIFR